MRDTTRLRKMCVRQGDPSTPSVAYRGIAICCKRNSLEKSPNSPFCDLSIGDLTIDDLAIGDHAVGCLGVFMPLKVLMFVFATNIVKMMKRKKVARNRSSNFDSSILILLAMLHRMVSALFSRSS